MINENEKTYGAIYTPDKIASLICKSALLSFINTKLKLNYRTFKKILAEKDLKLQKKIIDTIKDIRILDPSCGTGQFLLKMLENLIKIYLNFTQTYPELINKDEFQLKQDIVLTNLFGVDINPDAVKECKKRLNEYIFKNTDNNLNRNHAINLNFNILIGNAVIGFYELNDELKSTLDLNISSLLEKKNLLINRLRKCHQDEDFELKKEISILSEVIQKKLTNLFLDKYKLKDLKLNFIFKEFNINFKPFHWINEFSFIFNKKLNGFDIIIGNPPYVKADHQDRMFQEQRKIIETIYSNLYEKWDLYIAFMELSLNLLKEDGILAFIIPDAFSTAKYARKMRQILLSKTILFIYFFPEVKIFRNIGVYNIILCVQNKPKDENQILKRIIYKEIYQIKKVELIYQDELTEDIFKYETKRNDLVLLKSSNIVSLGDICYISVGMVLNSDEKKYKDLFKKKDLISSRKTNIHYKTYIENKYVDKFYPRKTAFLEFNTSRVPSKIRRATFIELYTNKKILVGKMGGRALFDDQGILCNDSMIVLVPYNNLIGVKNKILTRKNVKKAIEKGSLISKRYQLKYLLGIINSDFATNFFNSIRSHRQKNYVNPNELRQLPIFKASCDQQNLIIQTVELLEKNRKIKFSIDDLSMQESLDEEYKDLFKLLNKQIKSLYLNNDPITNE